MSAEIIQFPRQPIELSQKEKEILITLHLLDLFAKYLNARLERLTAQAEEILREVSR